MIAMRAVGPEFRGRQVAAVVTGLRPRGAALGVELGEAQVLALAGELRRLAAIAAPGERVVMRSTPELCEDNVGQLTALCVGLEDEDADD